MDCVHYVLGQNTGVDKHVCPMGHILTKYSDEEYRTILDKKDWACSLCGTIQHGSDGSCCEFDAQAHLHEHLKMFAETASDIKPGSKALESGKVKDMRAILNVFLNPHGRTGQGLIPGGWKEAQKSDAVCDCVNEPSEDPEDQSAVDDPNINESILDTTLDKLQELAIKLLDQEDGPPQLDPNVWNHGDYMTQWLASEANIEEIENPWNSSDYDTYPGTALIVKGWGANNKLTASKLSQFPCGGLVGTFQNC